MVKARTWLVLVVISFGTLASTVGCGSDETLGGGMLIPGGGGGSGGAGAVGRGGTGGSSGTIVIGNLGKACAVDADCGSDLFCLPPNGTSVGGPGNGMCTARCPTQMDAECQSAETGAACLTLDGTNFFCFESCVQGDPSVPTDKCQGRNDFLCLDFNPNSVPQPFCVPFCQTDAECGSGSFCSKKDGLCQTTRPTGDPVGTACDPNAAADPCAGVCLQTSAAGATPVTGACAEFCAARTECAYSGTKPGGFCALFPQGQGFLDLGVCESGCNCDSDCPFPGDVCQAWFANAGPLPTDLASAGFCFPNAIGSTELTCGEGGAGNVPGGNSAGAAGN